MSCRKYAAIRQASHLIRRVLGLLVVALAMACLAPPIRASAATGSSYSVEASVDGYDTSEVKLPTGTEATFYSTVTISDELTSASGLVLTVTVPRTYLDSSYYSDGINISGGASSESVASASISSDDNNFYITYNLNTLSGGTVAKIPVGFKTLGKTTDDGTSFTITAQLSDSDGSVVSESSVYITNTASYDLYAVGYIGWTNVGTVYSSTTSSNESEVSTVYAGVLYNVDSDSAGTRTPSMIRVYVQLADNILFDSSYTIGAYTNDGWTYDESTGCIYKDIDVSSDTSDTAFFVIKGLSQKYNTYFPVGTAWIQAYDGDGNLISASVDSSATSSTTTVRAEYLAKVVDPLENQATSGLGTSGDYTYTSDNEDTVTLITHYVGNSTEDGHGTADQIVYVSDMSVTLNEHQYATQIKLTGTGSVTGMDNNQVYLVYSDGTEVLFAEDVAVGSWIDISSADNYQDVRTIRIVYPDEIQVPVGAYAYLYVNTKVFTTDWETALDADPTYTYEDAGDLLNTYLYVTSEDTWYSYPSTTTGRTKQTLENKNPFTITAGAHDVLSGTTSAQTAQKGDDLTITFTKTTEELRSTTEDGQELENPVFYVELPNGWGWDGSATLTYTDADGEEQTVTYNDLEVIYGIDMAARWFAVSVPDFEAGTDVSLSFDLTAQTNTPDGSSEVVGWLAYDNTELINLGYWSGDSTPDAYDLNQDGSTDDLILSDTVGIVYTPSSEVYATATAGTSIDDMTVGTTQSLQEGSSLYLGMNVINNQDTGSVNNLTLVDILPYAGDTTVVPDETGTLVSRGSQYEVNITGPVEIVVDGETADPADYGYTVLYSTEEPSTTSASDNMNATWVSGDEISDWSTVTMIKIVMDDGTTIAAGSSVEFVVPAEIPLGAAESFSGDEVQIVAVNSFAYATNSDPDADDMVGVQGVTIPMTRAFISGNVFDDFNYDEIREAKTSSDSNGYDERGLSGVTVSAYDTDGTLITQTTTDDDGNYTLAISSGESVTITFTAPDGYEFASSTVDTSQLFPTYDITSDDATDSDGDAISNDVDSTGSATVTLDYNGTTVKVNAGLQQIPLSADVTKTWVGGIADAAAFTLSADDQTQVLTLTSDDAVSDGVWSGSFTGLRSYDPEGNTIDYTLAEDSIEGYATTISGSVADGFSVTNTKESDSQASDGDGTDNGNTSDSNGTDGSSDSSDSSGSSDSSSSSGSSDSSGGSDSSADGTGLLPGTGDVAGTSILGVGALALIGLLMALLVRRRCTK